MARFYTLKIDNFIQTNPPIAPLTAIQLMKGARVRAVMNAQDKPCGASRRSLGRLGLLGTFDTDNVPFSTPNTDPDDPSPATQVYPDPTTFRTYGYVRAELTPGCFPKASILYIPSGETQIDDGASGFDPGGAIGQVRFAVTFSPQLGAFNFDVSLPESTLQFGAASEVDEILFGTIQRRESPLMAPNAIYTGDDELRKYTRPPVGVDIEVQVKGGVRIVDLHVFESPVSMAVEADDTANSYNEWCAHYYAQGVLPFVHYPYQHRSPDPIPADGNPTLGTHHLLNVHHAQATRLGAQLFHWSAHDESTFDPTDNTFGASVSITSTTFVGIPDTAITAWDEDSPGWSLSCGGYDRNFDNNSRWVMRDRRAVVPAVIAIHADVSAATNPVAKIQASPGTIYEIALVADWTYLRCHLPCGINPQQTSHLQIFAKVDSGTLEIHSATGWFSKLPLSEFQVA